MTKATELPRNVPARVCAYRARFQSLRRAFLPHADMLLVTGPVSRHTEEALLRTYDATPASKRRDLSEDGIGRRLIRSPPRIKPDSQECG